MENTYCVVTFDAVHHALAFEKFMNSKDIIIRLIPVPRSVSSSCGTAAQIPCDLLDEIKIMCDNGGIRYDEFHRINDDKKESLFSKLF